MNNRPSFLKDLRIADLELLISSAHLKNLGKAATLHHLSQSAASVAIQRVERAFGKTLCTHERRIFRLTKQGQLLLPKLETWLKHLHDTIVQEKDFPLRIATTHAIARAIVSPLLKLENVTLTLYRPDGAYGAVLLEEVDIALVLDNSPWKGVTSEELCKGYFQLYSKKRSTSIKPVILPEDQPEVVTLRQKWKQLYHKPIPIKARIPSWSLIADMCLISDAVGFLPDFLAKKLYPVSWQPSPSPYRLLALYKTNNKPAQMRFIHVINELKTIFS